MVQICEIFPRGRRKRSHERGLAEERERVRREREVMTKSLRERDLEELRGCLELGFGFCYEDIPELCNTLPALHLCSATSISKPGDDPEEVKARLRLWAQAVACMIRLCT